MFLLMSIKMYGSPSVRAGGISKGVLVVQYMAVRSDSSEFPVHRSAMSTSIHSPCRYRIIILLIGIRHEYLIKILYLEPSGTCHGYTCRTDVILKSPASRLYGTDRNRNTIQVLWRRTERRKGNKRERDRERRETRRSQS
jgi:hypothetical protein